MLPAESPAPKRARAKKKKPRAPTQAEIRIRREKAPRAVKEFDARKTYKVGDIITHHRYGYGEVVEVKGKEMTVKFEKAGKDRRTKRKIKIGRATPL